MPSRGSAESDNEFCECTDQLREKYQNSHEIIIAGDLNTNLSSQKPLLKRTVYLKELIEDFGLLYDNSGKNLCESTRC